MNRNVMGIIYLGLVILTVGTIAHANSEQESGRDRDWSFKLGPMALYVPEYEGSDDYGFVGFPLVYANWRDIFFIDPRMGMGVWLWNRNHVKLGVHTVYSPPRDEGSSSDLYGMGDIEDGAVGGAILEYGFKGNFVLARIEDRYAGEDTGLEAHLGLGRNIVVGQRTLVQPFLKATWSSSDYMNKFFGITADQSGRSGLATYDAGSSVKSVGLELNAFYGLTRRWTAQGLAEYSVLLGDAADSPLVKEENKFLLGAGVFYAF